jgi:hypothetical protein
MREKMLAELVMLLERLAIDELRSVFIFALQKIR